MKELYVVKVEDSCAVAILPLLVHNWIGKDVKISVCNSFIQIMQIIPISSSRFPLLTSFFSTLLTWVEPKSSHAGSLCLCWQFFRFSFLVLRYSWIFSLEKENFYCEIQHLKNTCTLIYEIVWLPLGFDTTLDSWCMKM